MKKYYFYLSTGLLLTFIVVVTLRILYVKSETRSLRTKLQIGDYYLDTDKTKLGTYTKNIESLKNLKIVFKENGTFFLSKDVPFLPDSLGIWKSGGGNEFNTMIFQNWENFQAQYSECCSPDSTFELDVILPKKGREGIDIIYFKKINPSLEDLQHYDK